MGLSQSVPGNFLFYFVRVFLYGFIRKVFGFSIFSHEMNHIFIVCDIFRNINFHSFHQISSTPEYLKYNVNSMKHNESQL